MPDFGRHCQTGVLFVALLLLLGACSNLQQRQSGLPPEGLSVEQRVGEVDFDQLLAFNSDFARLSPPARLAECHKLMQEYARNRQLTNLLRVLSAQMVTDGCGTLAETTRVARAVTGQIKEARLRGLLTYQFALADRTVAASAERNRLIRRVDYARYNLKKALTNSRQAQSSSKQALSRQREALSERQQALSQTREIYRQMVNRDAEARQLREKLDALKSIEQDVNDTER